MIVGHGMIGKALKRVDAADVLYCASGVSNLFAHIAAQCARETQLLKEVIAQNVNKTVVYFSSYSINDADDSLNSPYLLHKKKMEALVKSLATQYLIVRTSNVVGRNGQPGNLTNFIFNNMENHRFFEVWQHTNRNLIDVEHLAEMTGYYLQNLELNKTVYLINPIDVMIEDVVKVFEQKLNKKARYQLVDKGVYYQSDKTIAAKIFSELGIATVNYTEGLVMKYFV